jgi:uncharacterized repeat protein (TIGR03806 family)
MRLALAVISLLLAACQQPPSRDALAHVAKESPPEVLSEWHLFEIDAGMLQPTRDGVVYELNTPLFSDYAHKLRAVHVPAGTAIRSGEHDLQFPVGTIITKTFYYPRAEGATKGAIAVRKVLTQAPGASLDLDRVRLLETRLLINTSSGWVALPYVWNAEQTEATLALAGDTLSLELVSDQGRQPFAYLVPDTNQCAGCHALEQHSQKIEPIGVRARHLNRTFSYGKQTENQLAHWQKAGLLGGAPDPSNAPRNAQWDDPADGEIERDVGDLLAVARPGERHCKVLRTVELADLPALAARDIHYPHAPVAPDRGHALAVRRNVRLAPVVRVERPRLSFAIENDDRVGLGSGNQKALAVG